MKDSNDKQTVELLDKPRPGRPSTGKAKSQAQLQREYRQRLIASGTRPVLLTAAERAYLVQLATDSRWDGSVLVESIISKLMDSPLS